MSATPPVTQRDVANACGLHPSTVCLALKNSPSIPASTRRRVQAVADELGYSPNVAARNLALLRTERKVAPNLPLAWINQEARRDHWRTDPEARPYFDGARRRAEESGYHLEEFWTQEPGMTPGRIVQILRARGVEGVLFPAHRAFDFALLEQAWGWFSMVGCNDHRLAEWIDVVCPDYYRNTDLALQRLRELGFARIGLVTTPHYDAATNRIVRSSFLRHQADTTDDPLPVCFVRDDLADARDRVGEWIREYAPQALLCHDGQLIAAAAAVAGTVPWIRLGAGDQPEAAGVQGCPGDVASAAVDCLVEKVRRFDRGTRESTRLHTIRGSWSDGGLRTHQLESVVA